MDVSLHPSSATSPPSSTSLYELSLTTTIDPQPPSSKLLPPSIPPRPLRLCREVHLVLSTTFLPASLVYASCLWDSARSGSRLTWEICSGAGLQIFAHILALRQWSNSTEICLSSFPALSNRLQTLSYDMLSPSRLCKVRSATLTVRRLSARLSAGAARRKSCFNCIITTPDGKE